MDTLALAPDLWSSSAVPPASSLSIAQTCLVSADIDSALGCPRSTPVEEILESLRAVTGQRAYLRYHDHDGYGNGFVLHIPHTHVVLPDEDKERALANMVSYLQIGRAWASPTADTPEEALRLGLEKLSSAALVIVMAYGYHEPRIFCAKKGSLLDISNDPQFANGCERVRRMVKTSLKVYYPHYGE